MARWQYRKATYFSIQFVRAVIQLLLLQSSSTINHTYIKYRLIHLSHALRCLLRYIHTTNSTMLHLVTSLKLNNIIIPINYSKQVRYVYYKIQTQHLGWHQLFSTITASYANNNTLQQYYLNYTNSKYPKSHSHSFNQKSRQAETIIDTPTIVSFHIFAYTLHQRVNGLFIAGVKC